MQQSSAGDFVTRSFRHRIYLLAAAAALGLMAAAWFAPYVYAEYEFDFKGGVPQVLPKPTESVAGRWFDDYFVVEPIDSDTFAIGEPRYYQGNYSYLIVGTERAILFDAGTGLRNRCRWCAR